MRPAGARNQAEIRKVAPYPPALNSVPSRINGIDVWRMVQFPVLVAGVLNEPGAMDLRIFTASASRWLT